MAGTGDDTIIVATRMILTGDLVKAMISEGSNGPTEIPFKSAQLLHRQAKRFNVSNGWLLTVAGIENLNFFNQTQRFGVCRSFYQFDKFTAIGYLGHLKARRHLNSPRLMFTRCIHLRRYLLGRGPGFDASDSG